ncbi:DUF3558 domain-containing protein [Nocardia higoensis]|uniref:DUF3558 domain-containing protein n=1 Tax=Nocardia higoensis TaxID=228599 RepID=A0ABS0D7E2_9NOCA|nr:DUF3558 domain-containing protein [Nocardia higoensis]MBF6354390.1 DUF3558 domain-containing protein [Nocardia higoensis]
MRVREACRSRCIGSITGRWQGRRCRSAPVVPRIFGEYGVMMSSRSGSRWLGVAAGFMLTVTGCGTSQGGEAAPDEPSGVVGTVAVDVPSGFDPCEDIPQSILDSEKLRQKISDDSTISGGIKWRGCMWGNPDGYAVSIRTTNITVEMVRSKTFPDTREFRVAGREAISSRQSDIQSEASCTLDVAMKGGSLEFGLTNPPSAKSTGHIDACDLAYVLAEKIVPLLPASA